MFQLRSMRFIIPHIDGLESPVPKVIHVSAASAEDHPRMFCASPIDDMDGFRSKHRHSHNFVWIHDRTNREDLS
jgi:hypothetical protein